MTRRGRLTLVGAIVAGMVSGSLLGSGGAPGAPTGPVDAGIPFSSAVYGTGCTYSLTVPVNSSGTVTFWERRPGEGPRYIGRAVVYQLSASVWWTPRRRGDRTLYAVHNGVRSPLTVARVHQGYGSGGLCLAL